MTTEERIAHIGKTLDAIQIGWPMLRAELQQRADDLTEQLVNNDNEQTRGRIKQLREVMNLPETLAQERQGLSAALAEQAAAD